MTEQGTGLVYETEFITDLSGDYPERLVKLVLNQEDVADIRRAVFDAHYFCAWVTHNSLDASAYLALGEFLVRLEKQLARPAVNNLGEWKATNGSY